MATIAVDLGFSSVKVKTAHREFSFPTLIKAPRYDVAQDGVKTYDFGGRSLVVGDNSVTGRVIHKREFSFLLEYAPILIAHAIYLSDFHLASITEIRVGIPYEDYLNHREETVERVSNVAVPSYRHQAQVRCMAQGVGAFAEYYATTTNPENQSGYVLDIGFNTLILIKYDGPTARKAGSEQLNHYGLSEAMGFVGSHIKREFDENKSNIELCQIFRARSIFFCGENHDLSEVCDAATRGYLERVFKELFDSRGDEFKHVGQLVITGGGAHYVSFADIPEKYQRMTTIVTDRPEYANVRGMFCAEV